MREDQSRDAIVSSPVITAVIENSSDANTKSESRADKKGFGKLRLIRF